MKRLASFIVALSLAAAGVAAPPAESPPNDYLEHLGRAEQAVKDDKWPVAVDGFKEAARAAAEASRPDLRGAAELRRAQALRAWSASDPKKTDELRKQLEECYEVVIACGKPADRELAANNLGVLRLRKDDVPGAIVAFRTVPNPSNPDAFVFYSNFGRALAKDRQPTAAKEQFWNAVRHEPAYGPAADALTEAIVATKPQNVSEANALLTYYCGGGRGFATRLGGRIIARLLAGWGNEQEADGFLRYLLTYYARSGMAGDRFATAELPRLREVVGAKDRFKGRFETLEKVYLANDFAVPREDPLLDREATLALLDGWRDLVEKDPAARANFVQIFKAAGADVYHRGETGKPAAPAGGRAWQAAARYAAAFSLDHADSEAALFLVSVLGQAGDSLPGARKWLDQFAEQTLMQKSALYQKAESSRNWADIHSLHVVLANAYELEGKWGTQADPRGAIFQWSHAVQTESKLRARDPRTPQSFAARYRLADACLRGDQRQLARRAFVDAADVAVNNGNAKQAKGALAAFAKVLPDGGGNALASDDGGSVMASDDGGGAPDRLASRAADLEVVVANLSNLREMPPLKGSVTVQMVSLNSGGDAVAASGSNGVSLWDLKTGNLHGSIGKMDDWGGGTALAEFVPRSTRLVCAYQGRVEVWDAAARAKVGSLGTLPGGVRTVAASPDGRLAAAADYAGNVRIWDASTLQIVRNIETVRGLTCLALARDGKQLAVGHANVLTVWDVATGERVGSLEGHSGPVTAVEYSPDGLSVASASADGTAKLWPAAGGAARSTLKGHSARVVALAYNADGSLLATTAADRTVRLWNVKTGREVARLAPSTPINSLTFTPAGHLLLGKATPEGGNSISVWDVSKVVLQP